MPNDVITTLKAHRSIRQYTDDPIPDEHVREAVEAGQAASTSSAIQAYCVIRVRDPEARRRLAELTGPQEKVAASPAFFVVCGDTRRHRLACARDAKAYDARLESFLLAVIDATLFAQNMAVAFESMGYGLCYIGGLRNNLFEVDKLLELPEGVYPLYGLCVGAPAQSPLPRPRLPVESVLFEERYPADQEILAQLDAYDGLYAEYLVERGAEAGAWSTRMAEMFSAPRRADAGDYYRSKGADLS